jgi:hypothetical protein
MSIGLGSKIHCKHGNVSSIEMDALVCILYLTHFIAKFLK